MAVKSLLKAVNFGSLYSMNGNDRLAVICHARFFGCCMAVSLKVVDWIPGRLNESRPDIRLVSETATARELILARLEGDYSRLHADHRADQRAQKDYFEKWLVNPGQSENTLNGERLYGPVHTAMHFDMPTPLQMLETVEKSFAARELLLFFDHTGIERMDQRFAVADGKVLTFIKLVPLEGG